jgi:hypothetical protein
MTARRRKTGKVGGRRAGAGRPPLSAAAARSVRRTVPLLPSEAAAHDEARGETPWAEWIREAADLAIRRARRCRLRSTWW